MKLLLILFLFIVSSAAGALIPADTIRLSALGILPDTHENVSSRVQQAVESCHNLGNTVIVFEKGRYDFWPEGAVKKELYISNCTEDDTLSKVKNIALWLEGLDNLTIAGNGAKLVLHGKMLSFALHECHQITIKNLSIDYERPTMSELSIRSFSDSIVVADIHPDSHYLIENGKLIFAGEGWRQGSYHTILFESGEEQMKYSTFSPFAEAIAVEKEPYRIEFRGDFSKTPFKPGDVLTTRDPYRDNCGAFINRSSNIRIENVQMNYMHGLGIVSQFSENITLFKVDAVPDKQSGRIISCFADCFHFSGCKGLVLIDSCRTSGSHDDPVNVHGTHLQIVELSAANKLRVRFMHHQTYGFGAFIAGDSIVFIDPSSLQETGLARVKTARMLNRREMELETEEPFPLSLQTGICVENITWTPAVVIRNCRFERTNTRGVLLTTRRKIVVEGNVFLHTGMSAILIADDAASWFESGMVKDVLIRGNHFIGCGYNNGGAVIAIEPENRVVVLSKPVHRNIRIENNDFDTYGYPVLKAKSVKGMDFTDNRIRRIPSPGSVPENNFLIKLNACSGVTLLDNSIEGEFPGREIHLENMTLKDICTDKKGLSEFKIVKEDTDQ